MKIVDWNPITRFLRWRRRRKFMQTYKRDPRLYRQLLAQAPPEVWEGLTKKKGSETREE